MQRVLIDLMFACIGGLVCVIATFLFKEGMIDDLVARIGFGLEPGDKVPLSIQTLIWIVFAVGAGELLHRVFITRQEARVLNSDLLPPGHGRVYRSDELGDLYMKANSYGREHLMSRAVMRLISNFQISESSAQSNSVLQVTLDLFTHEVEQRYSFLRYLLWLMPSLGFIGTVWGIGGGLQVISDNPPTTDNAEIVLPMVTAELAVAFDTTLMALLLTSVLAYALHIVQSGEEEVVNGVGERCVDELVNQFLEPQNDRN